MMSIIASKLDNIQHYVNKQEPQKGPPRTHEAKVSIEACDTAMVINEGWSWTKIPATRVTVWDCH